MNPQNKRDEICTEIAREKYSEALDTDIIIPPQYEVDLVKAGWDACEREMKIRENKIMDKLKWFMQDGDIDLVEAILNGEIE